MHSEYIILRNRTSNNAIMFLTFLVIRFRFCNVLNDITFYIEMKCNQEVLREELGVQNRGKIFINL